ncbi:hypothetical protein LCGC14_2931380, partial [marine sediment metagenome]
MNIDPYLSYPSFVNCLNCKLEISIRGRLTYFWKISLQLKYESGESIRIPPYKFKYLII